MLCSRSITLVSSLPNCHHSLQTQPMVGPRFAAQLRRAIVGAGEPACGVCGASTAVQPALRSQHIPDRETLRFARAVLNRPYKFTITFLVANLFVFLMWESSGLTSQVLWSVSHSRCWSNMAQKLNSLIAGPNPSMVALCDSMFIHVNLIHILVNMYLAFGSLARMLKNFMAQRSSSCFGWWTGNRKGRVVASYLTVRPSLWQRVSGLARFHIPKRWMSLPAGASGALRFSGLVGVLFAFGDKVF